MEMREDISLENETATELPKQRSQAISIESLIKRFHLKLLGART